MDITLQDIMDQVEGQVHDYTRYVALCCPFHDDRSPSLMAYAPRHAGEHGYFQCKACGKSGNLEMLFNALQGFISPGLPSYEATSYDAPYLPTDLVEQESLALDAHLTLMQNQNHLGWYLEDRGVDWCIEPFGLGWYEGWYVMPIRNEDGVFQGMILRSSPHVQETANLRFHQPRGQKPLLYMPDRHLVEKSSVLFVNLGMIDCLTLATLRFPSCTSTTGKDSFDPGWLDDIRKPIIIIPDRGEGASARRLAGKFGWRGDVLNLQFPDGCDDANDYLKHGWGENLARELARYV